MVFCMALGQVTVSYPPVIPRSFPEPLQDFISKFVFVYSLIIGYHLLCGQMH